MTRPRRFAGLAIGLLLAISLLLAFAVADQRTRPLLANTLVLAAGSALISLPLAVTLALLIHRTNLPGHRWVHGLVTLMLFVPPYLQVAGWDAGFGLQGWFCRYWFPHQPVALLTGWTGAIWIQTLVNIPWIVLILGAALNSMPAELEEQASLHGSPLRVLWHVTLPMLRGAMAASGLAVFVLAAGEITITDVYQIRTFAEEIYTGFALGDSLVDVPLRTLPGMLLLAGLALAALLACAHVSRQFTTAGGSRRWRADVCGWKATIWLLLVAWLALMVAVPLGNLLYQAGMQVTAVGPLRERHWSAVKALGMLAASPRRFAQEYAWSFALAQLTSISLLLVVVPLAWASRRWMAVRMVAWSGVLVGLALPGPLLALLLGRLLNQPSSDWLFYLYDRTLVLPWLALSMRLFPFAYVLVELVVHRLPQRLLDLAMTQGAGVPQILRHAVWPELAPVVGWLWLVLVALSVADLSATVLAVPPGVTTVSIRIFNLVHYGVADQLAGLCLGTVMLFGGLAALVLGLRPAKFGAEQRRL